MNSVVRIPGYGQIISWVFTGDHSRVSQVVADAPKDTFFGEYARPDSETHLVQAGRVATVRYRDLYLPDNLAIATQTRNLWWRARTLTCRPREYIQWELIRTATTAECVRLSLRWQVLK